MKYVKIPLERVGVLIGRNGEVKQALEKFGNITLEIDSKEGEVVINDSTATDPLATMKVEDIIRAIGRGFSPEHALKLCSDEIELFIFDIYDYVGKKENHVIRLKSRVIGKEGKTKRVFEHLTGAFISVYGHTIALIADLETMEIAKRAMDMILSGSKHNNVYQFIEREMKKMKLRGSL